MSSEVLIERLREKANNEDEPDRELLRLAFMRLKHVEEALAFVGNVCIQENSEYAKACALVAHNVWHLDPFTDYQLHKVTLQ
jgi:hypothetical protein